MATNLQKVRKDIRDWYQWHRLTMLHQGFKSLCFANFAPYLSYNALLLLGLYAFRSLPNFVCMFLSLYCKGMWMFVHMFVCLYTFFSTWRNLNFSLGRQMVKLLTRTYKHYNVYKDFLSFALSCVNESMVHWHVIAKLRSR